MKDIVRVTEWWTQSELKPEKRPIICLCLEKGNSAGLKFPHTVLGYFTPYGNGILIEDSQ